MIDAVLGFSFCRDMFNRRHEFDGLEPETDPFVFASEYAVLLDAGRGNLKVCLRCLALTLKIWFIQSGIIALAL